MELTYKQSIEASGLDFVLSDESKDRMGDIIRADGWDLRNFKRNPIALFRHDPGFPIGNWKNLRVENKRLIGTLEPAPDGTSTRIDEIVRLVRAGVLKATSVGFRSLESKPLGDSFMDGIEFLRQELVETSVVSVPANPNALALAKELGVSDETRAFVFRDEHRELQLLAKLSACQTRIRQLEEQLSRMQAPDPDPIGYADANAIVSYLESRIGLYPYHEGWRWAHGCLMRELDRLLRK